MRLAAVLGLLGMGMLVPVQAVGAEATPSKASVVAVQPRSDGGYDYLVNGQSQLLIGMGYDAIYRYLPAQEREQNYRRDFALLRAAGVNTITGWDADKGYEQDKFDELTLDIAHLFDLGVVMALNLPPEGDYTDEHFVQSLMAEGRAKVERYKHHPALRMWGVGNEVFWEMDPENYEAFQAAYLRIADIFHELDPAHPVLYREAELHYVPLIAQMLADSGDMRPWLQFGMNIYDKDPRPLLEVWPSLGLDRPLFVSEFGAQGSTSEERANAYVDMWRAIREFPAYVLGGAPYVWTTAGPEPTDEIWGLMDAHSQPVDGTFYSLAAEWLADVANAR